MPPSRLVQVGGGTVRRLPAAHLLPCLMRPQCIPPLVQAKFGKAANGTANGVNGHANGVSNGVH